MRDFLVRMYYWYVYIVTFLRLAVTNKTWRTSLRLHNSLLAPLARFSAHIYSETYRLRLDGFDNFRWNPKGPLHSMTFDPTTLSLGRYYSRLGKVLESNEQTLREIWDVIFVMYVPNGMSEYTIVGLFPEYIPGLVVLPTYFFFSKDASARYAGFIENIFAYLQDHFNFKAKEARLRPELYGIKRA